MSKCSLNIVDFLHGLSNNITLFNAQLNQLSTQLVTPPAASPAPVSNFSLIPPAQPPSPPESPLFCLRSIWAPVAASYSNVR